jgi:hypothetical protein
MDGSKKATGKEKHHLFSVVVGDFRPLFKQDGSSSVNHSPKKTFFRRHIRGKKSSRNKQTTNGNWPIETLASGMRQRPGLCFEVVSSA